VRPSSSSFCAFAGLGAAGDAHARNTEYHLKIDEVLQEPEAQAKLGNDVTFRFGGDGPPGGAHSLGTFTTNKKSNSLGRPDEQACRRAMLSALI
jgi:hypothetical protein